MKDKITDFFLWLFNPSEWMRKKMVDIINDHAEGMSRIFEQAAQELGDMGG